MTNNEILKADLLDILFEHRNKHYGAYTLRRYYNNRLLMATGISFSLAALSVLTLLFNKNEIKESPWSDPNGNVIRTSVVEIPKPIEPEQQKRIEKKKVAQSNYQTFKVVKDIEVKEDIVDNKELLTTAISNKTTEDVLPDDLSKAVADLPEQTGEGEQVSDEKDKMVEIVAVPPSFPGGMEALALFFSKNITPPDELEPGEKKVVRVKFIVNADGSVTQVEIIQSSGERYEREVLRAFKRMPKWNPAVQNGHKIAVTFTQPVTFVGQEE